MSESTPPKPKLVLDSSPLITLALFPVHKLALEMIVAVAEVIVVETVAVETTAFTKHRDAIVIKRLIGAKLIQQLPVPITPIDRFIDSYAKVDEGERDTIRLALSLPDARLVLDDISAFTVATHFDLSPIMLLDLLASWAKNGTLNRDDALKTVTAVALGIQKHSLITQSTS
jgi:predicted nucleic acid-binding protein